jgi:DNA-binding LacI/PurR family transcriptional regulator
MGFVAAEILLRRMGGNSADGEQWSEQSVEPDLIVRESTAAAV